MSAITRRGKEKEKERKQNKEEKLRERERERKREREAAAQELTQFRSIRGEEVAMEGGKIGKSVNQHHLKEKTKQEMHCCLGEKEKGLFLAQEK